MFKYELFDYFDVLGNEEDGFEVNNLSHETIESDADLAMLSDKELIEYLISIGYFNESALDQVVVVDCGDLVEFELENGFPIGRLEPIE